MRIAFGTSAIRTGATTLGPSSPLVLSARAQAKAGSRQNRIVELRPGKAITIDDFNGALGHLDMGFGYAVGADTFNSLPNATILLQFPVVNTTRSIGPVVHFNKRWDIAAANHISHGNARAGVPATSQYGCGSNALMHSW